MLNKLTELKEPFSSVKEFLEYVRQGMPLAVFGVCDSFKTFLISCLDEPVLFIEKDYISVENRARDLAYYSKKRVKVLYPRDELLTFNLAFSKDRLYKRIDALTDIKNADIIVTTIDALMQTAPKDLRSVTLKKDTELSQGELIKRLIEMGYNRVDRIEDKGTFSLRGDILDIYSINAENPVRLDFFGDYIESIKTFDVESGKNVSKISEVKIVQAVENIYTNEELKYISSKIKQELDNADKKCKDRLSILADNALDAVEMRDFNRLANCSALSNNTVNVTELFPKNTVVIYNDGKNIYDLAKLVEQEFLSRFNSLFSGGDTFSFCKNQFILLEELVKQLNAFRNVSLSTLTTAQPFFNPLKILNPKVSGVINYSLDFKQLFFDIENWLKTGYRVLLYTGDKKRAYDLNFELSKRGIASSIDKSINLATFSGVNVGSDELNDGFIFHEQKIAIIGNNNLYTKKTSRKKVKSKKAQYFSAPEKGDYCVHENYGIGKVLGNKMISTTEGTKDYVAVEYYGGDILYIPVEQMDILTKYLGAEKQPRLSKIGGGEFERVKEKVKAGIKKMSFDLKKLYEERSSRNGYNFTLDSEFMRLFEDAFTYEDTPDQMTATSEILEDMTSDKVMDRLVCGDVGFGKTEVAFRGAFVAINNGKQVCMLAPTTILTEQHYNTAVERFSKFGINVAVLNRFKTKTQQTHILQNLKDGKIDLIIGTHRLLGKDVEFKDLGLLILDEEQRFGVEHKEKIKLLKKNVDTITLSATPIPRTLHMSLTGIRAISTINTPPSNRLPVQTYVTEETDTLIQDAISREINRGGQVFVLYNRVESIFNFAKRVGELLPNANVSVVHGQMPETDMEKNILAFYKGEYNVLIATTIIENGLDIPRANTIIVIDADRLGLSTLYQLKGRVGRGDRLAYAYFTFKRDKVLNDTAYKRLNAIMEFTEMGSGIKIAMRDLEIRGAGNVLGAEQHGHMDRIGYELYAKLLRSEITGEEEINVELDIRLNAYIPDEYISRNQVKSEVYKQIAEISSVADEQEIRSSLEDSYGDLPKEVDNLINIAVIKFLAKPLKITEININKSATELVFQSVKAFDNEKLVQEIEKDENVTISMSEKPALKFSRNKKLNAEILRDMLEFLLKVSSK